MVLPASVQRPVDLAEQLLDRGYDAAAGNVIRAISQNSTSGLIAQRLAEFEDEARRLIEAGETMRITNPVWRAVLADFEITLGRNAGLIADASPDVQATGIDAAPALMRQLALPGMSELDILTLGIQFNVPDPDQVARLINYVDSPAFAAELQGYQVNILETVQNLIIRGQVNGQNPIATARELRALIEGLPVSYANQIMRSLQLTAWREANVIQQVANANILEPEVIRIAVLDDRTCMACLVLHGTRLALGERVDGHRNCRCTSIPVVRGRPREVMPGELWFLSLEAERQQAQMGGAAYRAWQAGAIELRDLAQRGQDDLFGATVFEASLRGLLGEGARAYYSR